MTERTFTILTTNGFPYFWLFKPASFTFHVVSGYSSKVVSCLTWSKVKSIGSKALMHCCCCKMSNGVVKSDVIVLSNNTFQRTTSTKVNILFMYSKYLSLKLPFFQGTTGRVVDDAEEKISKMLKHFQEHVHNKFNRYAFGFFFCEFMNPCLALFSVYLTHKFLLDQYLEYGLQIYR